MFVFAIYVVPVVCVYRSEYSAFWKCVQAAAAYLVTQLCKMLFLATFFPASDTVVGQFDILGVSVHTLHLLFLFFLNKQKDEVVKMN